MNKKIRVINVFINLMAAFILVAVISSCNVMMKAITTEKVRKLGVYDKSVPKDQLAALLIPFHYTVSSFDGEKVKWKGIGMITTTSMIKIPAGEHTITYKYKFESGGTSLPKEEIRNNQRVMVVYNYGPKVKDEFDKELTVNFESGKIYIINKKEIEIFTNIKRFSNLD